MLFNYRNIDGWADCDCYLADLVTINCEVKERTMSIKGKWFYERFLPDADSYIGDSEVWVTRGKISDDLGNGFYEVEMHSPNNRLVSRTMNVSEMGDFNFVSSYDELLDGISKWEEIRRQNAELSKSIASMQLALDAYEE